jgi:hypothetical protein
MQVGDLTIKEERGGYRIHEVVGYSKEHGFLTIHWGTLYATIERAKRDAECVVDASRITVKFEENIS